MHVEDAMRGGRERLVSNHVTVAKALATLEALGEHALLVEVRYGLWRWVDRRDLARAIERGEGENSVADGVRTRPLVRTYADVPMDQAMRNLAVYPLLPVASRMNPNYLVGTLTLDDIHVAYGIPSQSRPAKGKRMVPEARNQA